MLPNVCWPRVGPCGRQGLLYGAAGPHLRSLAINYRLGAVQYRDPLPSGWPSSHLSPSQAVKEVHTFMQHQTRLSTTTCLLERTSKLTFSFSLNAEWTVYHSPSDFRLCRYALFRVNIVKKKKKTAGIYPNHMPLSFRMNMQGHNSKNEPVWYVS